MDGENNLHRLAQLAIASGHVPTHRPPRLWGGSGGGETCPICQLDISPIGTEGWAGADDELALIPGWPEMEWQETEAVPG
jgi:hypothetical protein